MELAKERNIDTGKLNVVFSDTTNSYKFYWFLAILDALNQDRSTRLEFDDLAMRMVTDVWFPLDFYKLSFGKQDGFVKVVQHITARADIDAVPNAPDLESQLRRQLSDTQFLDIRSKASELLRWVPYRFLRPFFSAELRGAKDAHVNREVMRLCDEYFRRDSHRVMYRFEGRAIILNDNWADYLRSQQQVLRAFTYWHLVGFLQKNNPNVPGLPTKILRPGASDRNLSDAAAFWLDFLKHVPDYQCIYSGQPVTRENFSLDHFLPWSFVVHNCRWNLVPVPRSVNSSKSDWLPDWAYFPKFAQQQYDIFRFYLQSRRTKPLEDYFLHILPGGQPVSQLEFTQRLEQHLLPQYQIAKNMGFLFPYVFK